MKNSAKPASVLAAILAGVSLIAACGQKSNNSLIPARPRPPADASTKPVVVDAEAKADTNSSVKSPAPGGETGGATLSTSPAAISGVSGAVILESAEPASPEPMARGVRMRHRD